MDAANTVPMLAKQKAMAANILCAFLYFPLCVSSNFCSYSIRCTTLQLGLIYALFNEQWRNLQRVFYYHYFSVVGETSEYELLTDIYLPRERGCAGPTKTEDSR